MGTKQIDCFKINFTYWKLLAIWPGDKYFRYYKYYSKIFILFFVIFYVILLAINFYFLPRQLDIIIEEMIFIFTELAIMSKVLTVAFMRDDIKDILDILECDIFQPDTEDALKIIENTKRFIKRYWKIVAVISYTSNLSHVLTPLFAHLFLPIGLELPISSYTFIPDDIREKLIYVLYFYQSIGMHFHMLYFVNIDGFFFGLINLTIAQLEILDYKLQRVTDYGKTTSSKKTENVPECVLMRELNTCIIHFDEISKFCSLVEKVFSVSLFVQFCMSSCIICVSLFRFTLPAPTSYYIFLTTYITVMVAGIMVPCWFGSRLMEVSSSLSMAIYNCDWTARRREFLSNMRLFVERMNKPLSISALNMFPLSLTTFTKIMNTAYSFYTVLRHMQTRES